MGKRVRIPTFDFMFLAEQSLLYVLLRILHHENQVNHFTNWIKLVLEG